MNILISTVKERWGVEGICGEGGKEIRGVNGGVEEYVKGWV